ASPAPIIPSDGNNKASDAAVITRPTASPQNTASDSPSPRKPSSKTTFKLERAAAKTRTTPTGTDCKNSWPKKRGIARGVSTDMTQARTTAAAIVNRVVCARSVARFGESAPAKRGKSTVPIAVSGGETAPLQETAT